LKPPKDRYDAAQIRPGFMVLFPVTIKAPLAEIPRLQLGLEPLPEGLSDAYLAQLSDVEAGILGRTYIEARRIRRIGFGRINLGELLGSAGPEHADVFLLTHLSGTAIWEVWMTAPMQSFDASLWIRWLDPRADNAFAVHLWNVLRQVNEAIGGGAFYESYFPLSILRTPNTPLTSIVSENADDIIRLLFIDHTERRLKPELVAKEIARDYCAHDGGLTLLASRSGLDLHGNEDIRDVESISSIIPPMNALPFLVTVELLLIERAVLKRLHVRLSQSTPTSLEELLALKQHALDGLEEYYGSILAVNRFSDAVAADGEKLLGIADLYDAVMLRLDSVSFAITTRYDKHMTLLQFWLTVVFGATEIGFIATSIATWYYRADLGAVLAWTVGTALASSILIALLLRRRLE
jgi:hypothetical protein